MSSGDVRLPVRRQAQALLAGTGMPAIRARVDRCVDVIRREYRDLPGLHFTEPQVRRFLGVDASTCDAVLRRLEQEHFLKHTDADDWVLDRIAMAEMARH